MAQDNQATRHKRVQRSDELLKAIEAAIEELPDDVRALVRMRIEKGATNGEIAEELSLNTDEVVLKLYRALRELRDSVVHKHPGCFDTED